MLQVDRRRLVRALVRSRWLIAATVAAVTGLVLVLSLGYPKEYEATATIVLDPDTSLSDRPDPESTQRELATIEKLSTSSAVEQAVAEQVGGGETEDSIESKVDSKVDELANLVEVTARDGEPEQASLIANTVATTFLDAQRDAERSRIEAAIAAVERSRAELQRVLGASNQVAALQSRIADLGVELANAGSDLAIAEEAEAPEAPAIPLWLRNAIVALVVSLALGVGLALARDRRHPWVDDADEVSRLLGTNSLAAIPNARRGMRGSDDLTSPAEREGYARLRAAIENVLPSSRQQVVLVTSAVSGEGKTTVAAQLGRQLAKGGHRTLVVSGDLRQPTLHEQFGLPRRPGLADALQLTERAGASDQLLPATAHAVDVVVPGSESSALHVLTSGTPVSDPGRLLSGRSLHELFGHIRGFGYRYILVDAPPLPGDTDATSLVPEIDKVLVVARIDRLTMDKVVELRRALDRIRPDLIGIVSLGGPDGGQSTRGDRQSPASSRGRLSSGAPAA